MKDITRKLILTLTAVAVAVAMGCGGLEPQDEAPHYVVDLKTGERVAKYVGGGQYELIKNILPAEDLFRLYPREVVMVMGESNRHESVVGEKGRKWHPGHWSQYATKKKDE